MSENGSPVTWRELNLVVRPLEDGQARIEKKVDELHDKYVSGVEQDRDRDWLGPRGHVLVNKAAQGAAVTLISGAVALVIAHFT